MKKISVYQVATFALVITLGVALSVIPIDSPDDSDQPKNKWKPENLRWNAWQQQDGN